MHLIRFGGLLGLACALLVPSGHAQISSSSSFQLADYILDSGGGGTASSNFAAWVAFGTPSSAQLNSPRFAAGIGNLETSNPQPTNGPVVFGITEPFGPKAGGNQITVSGLNFDKFGTGPSVTVNVGGNAATGVNVSSNTQLTAFVPAGSKGPQDLTVTSVFGAHTVDDGYVYTPAITATPNSVQGGTLQLKNYGTVGHVFNTYVSTTTGSTNTAYGTLLIGLPMVQLLGPLPFFGPAGVTDLVFEVPHSPALVALTVYYQTLDITSFGPLVAELTNRASTTFP
jgi:hypothetical protein